jgi:hypothetical protein
MRPKIHRKAKPIYLKVPEKVVTEYNTLVYSIDIFGRVHKRSKNNIKMASDRSLRLFENLPDDVKLILGDVFDLNEWEKIKDSGNIPIYLLDIEMSSVPVELRSHKLPKDTHLIENELPAETVNDEVVDDELQILNELDEDEVIRQLNELHNNEQLLDETISLQDVPDLYKNLENLPRLNDLSDNLPVEKSHDTTPLNPVNADIDERNILRGKRDRRVRFNFKLI